MTLPQKFKNLLAAPFAVSTIMRTWMAPGTAGIALFLLGRWQGSEWLQIAGAVLAAPLAWVYAVVIFVLIPFAIFDKLRAKLKARQHPPDVSR